MKAWYMISMVVIYSRTAYFLSVFVGITKVFHKTLFIFVDDCKE